MKEYDLISIGTGSAMSMVSRALQEYPELDVAVIENEQPGGICLTRGCIPSKMLLYPAEMVNKVREAKRFGIDVDLNSIDFKYIMDRMRDHIRPESKNIERNLQGTEDLDFYQGDGKFVGDYTLEVDDHRIRGDKIVLGTGSRPLRPPIEGLEETGYLTSRDILDLKDLPESVTIIGGGYIGAEYGYFLSMMGSKVRIIGKNPQFVPSEEENVSAVLEKKLSRYMDIHTGFEVKCVEKGSGKKIATAENVDGEKKRAKSEEILLAAGRRSNSDVLEPENTGVKTDEEGWIEVNDELETSKPNIWALGDATGEHMFKHVANYEARVVYENAFGEGVIKADYHAVPRAIFTDPQVASVGMKEEEAEKEHDILIGYHPFENTAKGSAMDVEDYFVKVIVEQQTYKILGAHIVGPQASVLIQEIIDLMYTESQNMAPIYRGMHIHPSLSEVVQKSFSNLHSHEHEHHH